MKCAGEGVLKAYADGALSADQSEQVTRHLQSCGDCRLQVEASADSAATVNGLLHVLTPVSSEEAVPVMAAYEAFRQKRRGPHMHWPFAMPRHMWAGMAAAACALTFAAMFAPARGWAQHVLEMLRVQNVAVVPVDMSDLPNDGGRGKLVAQFLSDNVVVTLKPSEPVVAANVADASALAGFAVRPLPGADASKISVSGPAAFHMTLNGDRVQALLDAEGRGDISVPSGLDGSTVAVYVPKSARLSYGDVQFSQIPTPTVSVPKTLDMPALAGAALQVAGMGAAEARAFCQGVDWTSTLVIPIPQGHSTYRTVPVDGVNGTLIEVQHGKANPDAAGLVWVKDGLVYSLYAADTNRVMAAAGSLR